jgi:FlaG/FlaF family flagellin (archaellin)
MSVLIIIGVILVITLAAIGLALVLSLVGTGYSQISDDAEALMRVRRETQAQSWQIHQRASAAFSAMLAASRQDSQGDQTNGRP